jgi:subtilisin family serine protease
MPLRRAAPLLLLLAGRLALPVASARASSSAEPSLELVSSHLRTARTVALQGTPLDRLVAADPVLRLRDGEPEIELRFATLAPATVEALRALGAIVDHVSYRYGRVLAHVDPTLLPALARLPGVTAIHPNYGAQQSTGAIPGQGDAALHADIARARFGVDGTGSRVGILSDSFDQSLGGVVDGSGCTRRLTGASPQFSGDLPAEVVLLDDGLRRGQDEGAGIGEIVHDIAPGAALLFASAYPDEATFAEHIAALAACGADVLVDDVLYFAEPMFQDGIVAQAAQRAADGGAVVFSAVGNQGRAGIDAVYRDAVPGADEATTPPTGDDFHDFGGGTRFASITVPPACALRLVLQWDEPFSGMLGPGASTDLDLYILGAARPDAPVMSGGTDSQGCARSGGTGGDPLEIADFMNTSAAPRTVYAAINHFCGRAAVRFRLVSFPGNCQRYEEFRFAPDVFGAVQAYGHPAAAGVAAVAAVFYGEVDSAGTATAPAGVVNVESFSARGGDVPIVLDGHGQALPGGPVTRFKPDFSAPDGVNTASFGIDSPYDEDSFQNFFGTSAAAPHAAAVAALLRQAHPTLSPPALLEALRATAVDIESPGRDVWSGAGLIDADAALRALQATPTPTPTVAIARPVDCNGNGRVTIDELIVGVRIALGQASLDACAAADTDGDGHVGIDELVRAVNVALGV